MNNFPNKNLEASRAWWPFVRDIIAFLGGFGIMVYETLGTAVDRPWLLVMAIGMMGLPFAMKLEKLLGKE